MTHLRRALELEPQSVDTHVALGNAHRARGRDREAETHARAALAIESEHLDALVLMGRVLLAKGDAEGAREHVVWALRINANDDGAVHLLASVKARESLLLGAWFRANSYVMSLGQARASAFLLALFLLQTLFRLAFEDLGHPAVAQGVRVIWLATCVYSWTGPAAFRRLVQKEIETVRLKPDY
jgi:tetratricopeptide (TPR) repeat protein